MQRIFLPLMFVFCLFSAKANTDATTTAVFSDPAANLLLNNSFEDNQAHDANGAANWTTFGPGSFSINQNENPMAFSPAQDGNIYKKMFAEAGMFQELAVTAGDEHTSTVYIQNATFDQMQPGCIALIANEYYDAIGAQILATQSDQINTVLPLDVWTQMTVTETAPVGAVTLRVVLYMNCPAGGAIMWDNACTSLVPAVVEPPVDPVAPIPTMGQWGLFLLALMTSILGVVAIYNNKRAIA